MFKKLFVITFTTVEATEQNSALYLPTKRMLNPPLNVLYASRLMDYCIQLGEVTIKLNTFLEHDCDVSVIVEDLFLILECLFVFFQVQKDMLICKEVCLSLETLYNYVIYQKEVDCSSRFNKCCVSFI